MKHGLTARVVLSDADAEDVRARLAEWRRCYWVGGPEKDWILEHLVIASIRLDRCEVQEARLRREEASRAALCWDDDRRDEAGEIAKDLADDPVESTRQLRRTKQGLEWLIERWNLLGTALEVHGRWSEAKNAMARDLMGLPKDLREAAPIADPEGLVAREVAHLERRLVESLNALDALQREDAEGGYRSTPSKAMLRLRRHKAHCLRVFKFFDDQMRPHRLPVPEAEPAPEPEPEPEPTPKGGRLMCPDWWRRSPGIWPMPSLRETRGMARPRTPMRNAPPGMSP